MRSLLLSVCLCGAAAVSAGEAVIQDRSRHSDVFGEERNYRVFLPPTYATDVDHRFPVIYFFHGYGGRYNGPEYGEPSASAESRYYDEWNGDIERSGPDPRDNIATYVSENDVIVVKWDGYVAAQYPRPYDVGPVKDDLHFVDEFPDLVAHIDAEYRTIPTREGRATSGLSMGGFMSMFVASKYPHVIGSASFFNPSSAFIIGPRALQVYTPFRHMGRNYVGLPIRQHVGMKDFLRQHDLGIDREFKAQELSYETWHYGVNYFDGFHTVVNVEGQFDFHMRHFRQPAPPPSEWSHIDVYPDFDIWGYRFASDRDEPGFTAVDEASAHGLKVTTRKWLPDGPNIPAARIDITTDGRYEPAGTYSLRRLALSDLRATEDEATADGEGRLRFAVSGAGEYVGAHAPGESGRLVVAGHRLDRDVPQAWDVIQLTPVLFNAGGTAVESARVELIAQTEDVEVLDAAVDVAALGAGQVSLDTSFRIRCRSAELEVARMKVMVTHDGATRRYLLDVPFYSTAAELTEYRVADGVACIQDDDSEVTFGAGDANGIADPGEWVSILTQSDREDDVWYGLSLFTDDPYVDRARERSVWRHRPDWSGTARRVSEVYIREDCPPGHEIMFHGVYDFQKVGDMPRDRQGAHSFVYETRRVRLTVPVGR
ncbi:hypothetical protein HN371_04695 [Candidatus Poribacteria bacterium]|nr:hypothetical protein [Candidatus Poribacteria bacterium]MBT5533771.1 hypothetical protein [Candidatus Poribacteria bacterium]MBT5709971.1 hypothetical protein [Candidatus Poribacteria bacterium]MBT7101364.1 hypothetical protein [Candidatus Poribacteria bacterium]MBT7805315.1 hypothetical protein [Candidatus Poribacteria bacterium]